MVIKDLPDLKKYLETRRELSQAQLRNTVAGGPHSANCRGMVYAYGEAIHAVDALMREQDAQSKEDDAFPIPYDLDLS